jgi:hypothetical protein
MITTTKPAPLVWGYQYCVDLGTVQELDQSFGISLSGNCQNTLDLGGIGRLLVRCEAEERADRSQAKVTATRTIFPAPFEIVEKSGDERCVDLLEGKPVWRLV